MFKTFGHLFIQIFGLSKHDKAAIAMAAQTPSNSQMAESFDAMDAPSHLVPYDENLLERARTQWQFGDWQSLANLDRDTLQHHPDRAKLVLLAAAGRLQIGQASEARQYIRLAQDWGCSKKHISQVLISGVHNSIGRAAAIGNQQYRSIRHFESAITISKLGMDTKLVTQARIQQQLHQLPIVFSQSISGQWGQGQIRLNTLPGAVPPAQTLANPSVPLQIFLTELHETLAPRFYFELGVGQGHTLALAKCKAVGIDPVAQERIPLGPNIHLITTSSDDFFAQQADIWLRELPLDIALIAGIPLVDYVLRSLIALEAYSQYASLVAIPGIYPRNAATATRHRSETEWWGDVWKLPGLLRQYRPDLQLLELDIEPAGLLLITLLDPGNKILAEKRNEYLPMIQSTNPPAHTILQRTGAASPDDSRTTAFLQTISQQRS